jgi:hypothetical protein
MASSTEVPRAVISFLREHVDHIVKLKFLLLMHSAPSGTSNVAFMAHDLDVPKAQVRDMANELVSDGLMRVIGDQLELALSIDERLALSDLASWYTRDRTAVLEVLRVLGRAS